MKTASDFLRDGAKMYDERAKLYGDNFRYFGEVMASLTQGTMMLEGVDDFNRFALLNFIVTKLTRYIENFDRGGHNDSLDDIAVYAMMLRELDTDMKWKRGGGKGGNRHRRSTDTEEMVDFSDGPGMGIPEKGNAKATGLEINLGETVSTGIPGLSETIGQREERLASANNDLLETNQEREERLANGNPHPNLTREDKPPFSGGSID